MDDSWQNNCTKVSSSIVPKILTKEQQTYLKPVKIFIIRLLPKQIENNTSHKN